MNIGLLGFGVVGGGVWELAQENRALNVKKVLVRREAPSLGKAAVQDVEAILRDTEIDTVVEVLGGLHPAYEWICRALAAGKDVVTANKAVISAYYRELTALARENGVALRCTAAVGGGIPVAGESAALPPGGHRDGGGRHHERYHQLHYGCHGPAGGGFSRCAAAGAGTGLCRGGSQR